jgi:Bacterial PH domain
MGHASEMSIDKLQKEFASILVEGERLEKAFKIIKDGFVFTNKRLILIDKQSLTSSKSEYVTIPYKSITRFSKESAGFFDMDAELKIWITGQEEPISKEFKKDNNINEVYQLLSAYILK